MINFLPPDAKSEVSREYVIRVASVWTLLLATVATVVATLLVPTYALLTRQLGALALEVVTAKDESHVREYQAGQKALTATDTLVRKLSARVPGPTASEVLREVQKALTGAVRVSGFSYEHTGTAVRGVTVWGVATTRASLAQFAVALERNPFFAHAVIPVSDLATEHDLPFTITLMLASVVQ